MKKKSVLGLGVLVLLISLVFSGCEVDAGLSIGGATALTASATKATLWGKGEDTGNNWQMGVPFTSVETIVDGSEGEPIYGPLYAGADTAWGGWVTDSKNFPMNNKKKGAIFEGVQRNGASNWAMAIVYAGEAEKVVDLVMGQNTKVGTVTVAPAAAGFITVTYDAGKNKLAAIHTGIYGSLEETNVGNGKLNGSVVYTEDGKAVVTLPYVSGTKYIAAHSEVQAYLGLSDTIIGYTDGTESSITYTTKNVPLIASKQYEAGTLTIRDNGDGTLTVIYDVDFDVVASLDKIHVNVYSALEDINSAPGKFKDEGGQAIEGGLDPAENPYKFTFDYVTGDTVYVAAHADGALK